MRRDDMPPLQRAVSDVLDEYLIRFHGLTTSHTNPDAFLEWLEEGGYTVVPKQAPAEPRRLTEQDGGPPNDAYLPGDIPKLL
jgi:hypothetical protein